MTESKQLSPLAFGLTSAGVLSELYPKESDFSRIDAAVSEDERWMLRAFRVGMRTLGLPSPNPTVGCVFVKDGKELATGSSNAFGLAHAEVAAMHTLSDQSLLRGSTAYVTLEPCAHHGKTPPCLDALVAAGIARCVIALRDPNPLVAGRSIEAMRTKGIVVTENVLANLARAWHQPFITHITEKRLFVALKWAQTLDGCLCDDNRGSQWISGAEARTYTHWLRQRYDAVAVSAQTFLHDKPQLTVRDVPSWVKPRQPLRVVLDLGGRIAALPTPSGGTKLIHVKPGPTAFRSLGPQQAELYVASQDGDLTPILRQLASDEVSHFHGKPLQSLLIEAGPNLLASFLSQKAFDLAHCYISPAFLGTKTLSLASLLPSRAIGALTRSPVVARANLGHDTLLEFAPF